MIRALTVVCLLAYASTKHVEDSVIHCTDSDFEDTLKENEISLVKFYAPWCGHCKKMAPEFTAAAKVLAENDPPVALIKVDCTTEKEACSKYGVSGYPTVKIFRGLEHEEYQGGRTKDDMISVMKAKAGPVSKDLTDLDAAEKFFNKPTAHFVVGYFGSTESKLADAHNKAATAFSMEYGFGHSTSDEVNKKYGHTDEIVLYRPKIMANKFEESKIVYSGKASGPDLKAWIRENALGLCGHRTTSDSGRYSKPLVAVFYDVDYTLNPKGTNYWRNRVMKVASKVKDDLPDVKFSINDKDDFAHELEELGIDTVESKPRVGMWDKDERKYRMDEDFSMDSLEQFVRDVMSGKKEPHMKSAEVSEDEEGVKVVVAKNFDEIVNDETKDVLIEFYAPWCGHCKSLAPKYAELATQLADEPEIVIAKMDATSNDVPKPYEVKGFPTIYFAPRNKKDSPVTYNGEREVKSFIKYLAKESTNELKGYNRKGKARSKEEL